MDKLLQVDEALPDRDLDRRGEVARIHPVSRRD
jgi:hypothetical protein